MTTNAKQEIKSIIDIISGCCREISKKIRHCNPTEMAHFVGVDNSSGDHIKYLDEFAQNMLVERLTGSEYVHGIISEEHESMYQTNKDGRFVVAFDPIDGSNNIEFNITTGTIFGIYRLNNDGRLGSGRDIVASGYGLYGGTTEFVYTDLGDDTVKILRTNEENTEMHTVIDDLRIPIKGKYYSVNQANQDRWLDTGLRNGLSELAEKKYSLRYVGSMVADVHRVIMNGGLFVYPADQKNKNGKIRYLYEAFPLAFIIEKIGGRATNLEKNILDLKMPEGIHDPLPVMMGSEYEMNLIEKHLSIKEDMPDKDA